MTLSEGHCHSNWCQTVDFCHVYHQTKLWERSSQMKSSLSLQIISVRLLQPDMVKSITYLFGGDGQFVGAIARTEARTNMTHHMRDVTIWQRSQQVQGERDTKGFEPGPSNIPELCNLTWANCQHTKLDTEKLHCSWTPSLTSVVKKKLWSNWSTCSILLISRYVFFL